jgi:flavin-dependent dehydrogenase
MKSVETVDVLIVGSGPSGISTALHLIQADQSWKDRIVVVDKAVHPREKLCGGGITHLGANVLADLGLPIGTRSFPVREVRLTYQDKAYSFHGNPVFQIVRRSEFDHWMVRQAEERGVTVRQGERVRSVDPGVDYVEVETDEAIIRAKVLVAADGSRSFIRSRLKWDDDSRVARLIEVDTPENPETEPGFVDQVALFDFTHMTDGLQGYYWDFPSYVNGEPVMNRGVFDSRARPERPKADLKETIEVSLAERDRKLEDYKLKGHPIRWFDSNGKFAMPRVILVGDAAGVDPLFGEGISFALGYGKPAAGAIDDAFARQDFSFSSYRQRVLDDRLLSQLPIRTRLARMAYLLKYPRLVRLGWRIARIVIGMTRWKDPEFKPAKEPELMMDY